MNTIWSAAFAAVIVASALGAPALAQSGQVPEIRIAVEDKSPQVLHAQVVRAAERLCREFATEPKYRRSLEAACVRGTIEDAIADSGNARLIAYHEALPGLTRTAAAPN